jgi:hypothetical protein
MTNTDQAFETILELMEKSGVKPILNDQAEMLKKHIEKYWAYCFWNVNNPKLDKIDYFTGADLTKDQKADITAWRNLGNDVDNKK